ncbi:hypothetical protein PPTG_24847 [Phytophthora nicotianae INRA-310]|uniref:Uncharacterized protein n=2 Tax=Phytophthora nicotianae TaxID=4792 RepID=W2P9K4_PHYN3|nr:hypothetical protein PPTG_24847 [Phytophthora nicotianae INRA-310]ETI50428.1 hypothetical protein F443_06049 [Phytophthora nicotianae P1569]ETM97722.1 hypothetical protein PPTG_24847 [Phytophthora nicotianae INRA-310]
MLDVSACKAVAELSRVAAGAAQQTVRRNAIQIN